MKYIIMCGGQYNKFKIPKQLLKVNGEILVERTINLLKKNGIKDIAVSTNNPAFNYLDVPIIHHDNNFIEHSDKEKVQSKYSWLNAYYLTKEPCCYLHGDVYFSDEAIKKIINIKVNDTMFFCTFDKQDGDKYELNFKGREPLAYKVTNYEKFNKAVNDLLKMVDNGKFKNKIAPFSWHLYRYLNNLDYILDDWGYMNNIFNTKGDYMVINDITTDVDSIDDALKIENCLKLGGDIKMVKAEVIKNFTLGRFDELKNIERKSKKEKGKLFVGDTFECTKEMAKYLSGDNRNNDVVIKIIEVKPEEKKEETKIETTVEFHEEKEPKVTIKKVTKKATKKASKK